MHLTMYLITKKDIVTIGAMMKCYIDNNQNENAISVNEQYDAQHNDVSNLVLMTAYRNIVDIDNAVNIFNNIPENEKNIEIIGAMMTAYHDNEEYNKSLNLFYETKNKNEYCMDAYLYVAAFNVSSRTRITSSRFSNH